MDRARSVAVRGRSTPGSRRLALRLGALLLLAACGRSGPALVPRVDLIDEFQHTEVARERDHIDLGSPSGGAVLVEGWSKPPGGDPALVWATERHTSLRLVLGVPAERRLKIRCGGVAGGLGRARGRSPVFVSLNRRRIGMIHASADMAVYELKLPKEAQRRGENLLEFEHPRIRRTPRVALRARPPRTVAYDWIEIETPGRPAELKPHVDRAGTPDAALVLPADARVDYYLRAPAAARLALDVAALGQPGGALRVDLQGESGDVRTLLEVPAGSGAGRAAQADLGTDAGEIVQLSLVSAGKGDVRLRHPVLLGSPPSAPHAATATADARAGAGKAGAPNVLLYVIDTLRADHLGTYGYALPTSPRIDALAREAVVFDRVIAQSSWTKPAMASVMTGLYPFAHGATGVRSAIRPEARTLAEILAAHGYATAAFVTNVNVSGAFGFARGFESFTYLPEDPSRPSHHVLSDVLTRDASRRLESRDGRPFFLYVHSTDPHAPYTAGAELRPRFRSAATTAAAIDPDELQRKFELDWSTLKPPEVAELVADYDAEIAFNDANLGALLDDLKRLGLDGSTLVVVTADHGEEFGDHGGFTHGHTLYDELIHVPLLIRLPGGRRGGERDATLARQIDLLPTILAEAGVAIPSGLPGRSLLAPRADDAPLEALSHTRLGRRDISALETKRWKVLEPLPAPAAGALVFDLAADPGEKHPVGAAHPAVAGYGAQRIALDAAAAALDLREPVRPPALDPDTERRLRALGYAD